MRTLPYPGRVSRASLPPHVLDNLNGLPKNITVIDEEPGVDAQVPLLSGARIVALPILKSNIAASGLSTSFNAMALGKCVIGTAGPGFSDIFTKGEVLTVPVGDPQPLAEKISLAWNDENLRRETGRRGYVYARRAGGRDNLYQRIIDQVALHCGPAVNPTLVPAADLPEAVGEAGATELP